ncbi:hypothetical protein ACIQUQ_26005 [Streptomyces sp. NPDC101118]|uniref:hypothetical protein n=1 Tax=Streptomyces sp. NPDC101118 TaxID=3366109 RepID=UPI0037F967BC
MTGTWAGTGWDQRAVALVELRGTTTDSDLFEEALAARGWPVLEKRAGPVSAIVDRLGWYTVELRFPGSSFRAVTGARHRLEELADDLGLALVVEAVDLVARVPEARQRWNGAERTELPDLDAVSGVREAVRAFPVMLRALVRLLGVADTGRQVRAAAEGPAQALAARPLPGVPRAVSGARVRPAFLDAGVEGGRRGRREPGRLPWRRLQIPGVGAVALGAGAGAAIARAEYLAALVAVLLVGVTVLGWAFIHQVTRRDVAPLRALAVGWASAGGLAAVSCGLVLLTRDQRWAGRALFAVCLGYLIAVGIYLLVRQSGPWRVVPWLLPALLPFVPGVLPAVGLSLPAVYLGAFGVELEDVSVPMVDVQLATLRIASAVGMWLLAPAVLGYARHVHLLARGRRLGIAAFTGLAVYTAVLSVQALVEPAAEAAREARAAAEAGRTPAPYYGVEPEWVCAGTVRPVAQVPVEGGVLDPRRAYLLVGDAGGTAVLWDRHRKAALKVPLAALRLVPAGDPRRTCP